MLSLTRSPRYCDLRGHKLTSRLGIRFNFLDLIQPLTFMCYEETTKVLTRQPSLYRERIENGLPEGHIKLSNRISLSYLTF